MADGTYGQIPTSQCEFGCAINGVCGTETQCDVAGWVLAVVMAAVGLAVLICVICFCCRVCKAAKAANQLTTHIVDDDFKQPTVVASYYPVE